MIALVYMSLGRIALDLALDSLAFPQPPRCHCLTGTVDEEKISGELSNGTEAWIEGGRVGGGDGPLRSAQ